MAATQASKRIILITGGNNGIGYETVKAFLQSPNPYHVYMGSRSPAKAAAALARLAAEVPAAANTVEPVTLDVTSDASIAAAAALVAAAPAARLDALINNAGANFDNAHLRGAATLRESLTRAYDANVAGAHVLTHALMPLLFKSPDPRLLFVAGLAQINQANEHAFFPGSESVPRGWPKPARQFEVVGYRCSKVALNMLMLDWAHKLAGDVKVWAVGPGFVETDLGDSRPAAKQMGAGDPAVSGRLMRSVVEGERDAHAGKVINRDGLSIL